MKEFIFRNRPCWYELNSQDINNTVINFAFAPNADDDFIDENGDAFFYIVTWDRSRYGQTIWASRNYENEVVDDWSSYFSDTITNDEFDYIEAFINSLLEEPEPVNEQPKYILRLSYSWTDEVVDIPCNTWGEAVQKAQSSAFEAMSTVFCHAYGNEINVSIDENDNITIYYPRRNQYDYFNIMEVQNDLLS